MKAYFFLRLYRTSSNGECQRPGFWTLFSPSWRSSQFSRLTVTEQRARTLFSPTKYLQKDERIRGVAYFSLYGGPLRHHLPCKILVEEISALRCQSETMCCRLYRCR